MDENEDGDKFCEEDIDQILKGRTQVIQIESEGKGSTFSKVSKKYLKQDYLYTSLCSNTKFCCLSD